MVTGGYGFYKLNDIEYTYSMALKLYGRLTPLDDNGNPTEI